MNKKMKDVQVGERFSVGGIEYIKTADVKVTCCKTINCEAVGNPNNKSYFAPDMEVMVNG